MSYASGRPAEQSASSRLRGAPESKDTVSALVVALEPDLAVHLFVVVDVVVVNEVNDFDGSLAEVVADEVDLVGLDALIVLLEGEAGLEHGEMLLVEQGGFARLFNVPVDVALHAVDLAGEAPVGVVRVLEERDDELALRTLGGVGHLLHVGRGRGLGLDEGHVVLRLGVGVVHLALDLGVGLVLVLVVIAMFDVRGSEYIAIFEGLGLEEIFDVHLVLRVGMFDSSFTFFVKVGIQHVVIVVEHLGIAEILHNGVH